MNHYTEKIKVLKDNKFTLHDIRRLRVSKLTQQHGIETAKKEM